MDYNSLQYYTGLYNAVHWVITELNNGPINRIHCAGTSLTCLLYIIQSHTYNITQSSQCNNEMIERYILHWSHIAIHTISGIHIKSYVMHTVQCDDLSVYNVFVALIYNIILSVVQCSQLYTMQWSQWCTVQWPQLSAPPTHTHNALQSSHGYLSRAVVPVWGEGMM